MAIKAAPRSRPSVLRLSPLTAAVTAVLGGTAIVPVAAAQDALEEIVVTAARRPASVQELPFNIAVVTGKELAEQRLARLTDFSRWVPGLTVVDQGPRAGNIMTVRGLNVRSIDATEFLDNSSGGTVATYIGDIPLYLDMRMKDLQRVEVLLGPQGTLYGAGTLGGAVRYIPNAPDTSEFTFDVQGNFYDLSESDDVGYETDFVVNVPLVDDKLALRAAVSYLDDPGFIDYAYLVRTPGVSNPEPDFTDPADVAANLRRVDDANTEETLFARLSLLWNVGDNVSATFNHYFQDQQVGARSVNHRDSFGTGPYESAHRFLEPNDRENALTSIEIVADLGFAELTSATGFSTYEEFGQRDQTDLLLDFEYGYETFPTFAAFTREDVDEERVNQEVRLVSNSTGLMSWIAGFYYNELDIDALSEEFTPGIPEWFGLAPPPLPTGDLEYRQITIDSNQEQALFGELTFDLSDRLNLTLGGRYFEIETEQFLSIEIPFYDIAEAQSNVADDDGFLGKISVGRQFSDNVNGYVTVSEGFRIGGANSVPECIQPLPAGQNACALPDEVLIKPDRSRNLEFGVRSTAADGRLMFNAAIFSIDWDDLQTLSFTQNGSLPITVNGSEARSQGVEFSFAASGDGPWSFRGAYAYTKAELTADAPGLVDGEDGLDGDRLSGTPEHQASFAVGYDRMLGNGWNLNANWGVAGVSDRLTKVGLRSGGEILGGYSIHNASVRLSRDRWAATLYADNLTNKYAETGVRQDRSTIRNVGGFDLRRYYRNVLRPRTVGIQFSYSFGD